MSGDVCFNNVDWKCIIQFCVYNFTGNLSFIEDTKGQ
jgi:hypothetical protein